MAPNQYCAKVRKSVSITHFCVRLSCHNSVCRAGYTCRVLTPNAPNGSLVYGSVVQNGLASCGINVGHTRTKTALVRWQMLAKPWTQCCGKTEGHSWLNWWVGTFCFLPDLVEIIPASNCLKQITVVRGFFCSVVSTVSLVVRPLPGDRDQGKQSLFLFWLSNGRCSSFVLL